MRFSKENVKCFTASMLSASLVLILLSGFVIVEKNTRYIAFGDTSPFFIYKRSGIKPLFLKVHFMGKDMEINFQ